MEMLGAVEWDLLEGRKHILVVILQLLYSPVEGTKEPCCHFPHVNVMSLPAEWENGCQDVDVDLLMCY